LASEGIEQGVGVRKDLPRAIWVLGYGLAALTKSGLLRGGRGS